MEYARPKFSKEYVEQLMEKALPEFDRIMRARIQGNDAIYPDLERATAQSNEDDPFRLLALSQPEVAQSYIDSLFEDFMEGARIEGIEINNALLSPLLLLPAELRNKIDFETLGRKNLRVYNTFHLDRSTPDGLEQAFVLTSILCQKNEHEDDDVDAHEFDCRGCPKLDLSVLLFCAQVRSEASNMPYSASTWLFNNAQSLTSFVNWTKTATEDGREKLRALKDVKVEMETEGYTSWKPALALLTSACPGIEKLSIDIRFNLASIEMGRRSQPLEQLLKGREKMILSLSALTFKILTISLMELNPHPTRAAGQREAWCDMMVHKMRKAQEEASRTTDVEMGGTRG